jgi:hypothetical protein
MKTLYFLPAAFVLTVLLSACGEFAYKRGGGPAELEQVQAECHRTAGPDGTYEQCMASHGWTVQNLEQEPLVTATTVNFDNRAAPSASPTATPATGSDVAATATTTKDQSQQKPVMPMPIKSDNPMDLLKINSMWKFGGTASELQDATDKCVVKLGEAHRPVSGQQQLMTRGLVACLREKGWYGVANR